MKQCRIASICRLAYHPCCKDCRDRACESRCLNSPERCGCWEDTAPPQKAPTPAPRKSKIDCQELLRLHKQGLLQRDIAQRLGCSTSAVSVMLREMGVKRYG